MPWGKKAAAPDFAYAVEEVRALITGTPDAWLADWLWLLGGVSVAVNPLCAAGPQTCAAFTVDDFLSAAMGGSRQGIALNLALLTPKLLCFVEQRLFSAYCELAGEAACGTIATRTAGDPTAWGTYPEWIFVRQSVSSTATAIRIGRTDGVGTGLASCGVLNPDNSVNHDILSTGHTVFDTFGQELWEMPWDGLYWGIHVNGGPPGSHWILQACEPAGPPTDYTPPTVYRPPSAIAPPAGEYPDLAAVGAELDLIERKLEILLNASADAQVAQLWPLVPVGGPFAVVNDEDISIPEGGGLVVAVANIGNQTDETYGEPRRLHRLGRVTVGGPSGWLPPFDITVTPMMLVGLPLEVSRARVHVMPPAVATVQVLQRAQPVG